MVNVIIVTNTGRQVIEVAEGTTVGSALETAGVSANGTTITLGGASVGTDAVINSNSVVTSLPNMKAGC